MLKVLLIIIFLIPIYKKNWFYIQRFFLIGSFFFILNFSSFNFLEKCGRGIGLDLMSYTLILLRFWICRIIIIGREIIFYLKFYKEIFLLNVIIILLFLLMRFSIFNLFNFYLCFERSLIPIFIIIIGWGFQIERLQAGLYILLYTLIGSLPLLIIIFYLYRENYSLIFYNIKIYNFNYNFLIYIRIIIGFLIKLPIFLLHLWLPKAHVEAPVAGSIILAGVILKLGGYGLIRFLIILNKFNRKFSIYLVIISLIGGILIRLNCIQQRDIKLLVAYSSVGHIGIILGGILTLKDWGLISSLTIILSHGLCSSGLFFLININYERIGSRNLFLVKGIIHYIPKIRIWWFLFCILNIAAPPSLNLFREVGLINSLISWRTWSILRLIIIRFFAAGYSLYLFSFNQHGVFYIGNYNFYIETLREYLILFLHWLPLNFLIINCDIIFRWLYLISLKKFEFVEFKMYKLYIKYL